MEERYPFIATYLIASRRNGTFYLGVTSNLPHRVWQHRTGAFAGFSKVYRCKTLVWFKRHPFMAEAFEAETRMKGWRRAWKLRAIEEMNPDWRDLAEGWLIDETDPAWNLKF